MTDRDSIVDVVFQIQEGSRSRIANLDITGNTRTKENVIRREATVLSGDTFRSLRRSCAPSATSSAWVTSRT